jgi:hypothetical protein
LYQESGVSQSVIHDHGDFTLNVWATRGLGIKHATAQFLGQPVQFLLWDATRLPASGISKEIVSKVNHTSTKSWHLRGISGDRERRTQNAERWKKLEPWPATPLTTEAGSSTLVSAALSAL